MKEICACQNEYVEDKFGVEEITNKQHEVYHNVKSGGDTSYGKNGAKMIEGIDKCIYFGGSFYVSVLIKLIIYLCSNALQSRLTELTRILN